MTSRTCGSMLGNGAGVGRLRREPRPATDRPPSSGWAARTTASTWSCSTSSCPGWTAWSCSAGCAPPGNGVPVVILTAHGSIPEAVEAMKLGAIDFLTKPTTPDALRRVVAEVIDRHVVRHQSDDPAARQPGPPHIDSRQLAFELARAKRAINRGQFSEAETVAART